MPIIRETKLRIPFFWGKTQLHWVISSRSFKGTFFKGLEVESIMFLREVGK
jgi:hypothetical protein